jgi:CheY-like chemotaxis protein/DNA-binding transcriptional regulator YiaG
MNEIYNNIEKNIFSNNDLDYYVGKKLKQRRESLCLSQKDLSEILDISYQQIQKYERGENKIPAGRLFLLSKALKVNPDYFFDGMSGLLAEESARQYIQIEKVRPIKILVVEDNPVDEMLTRDAIIESKIAAKIFVVHDGSQALKYLKKQEEMGSFLDADIVFLDINIPKRNGLEVLQEIKRDRTISHIPVIILTNSINPKDMEESYKYRSCGYISKSFKISEYNEKISLVLSYWSKVAILPSMQN